MKLVRTIRGIRDRKVGQWVLAYLAGAWVFLQVFDVVGDQFGLSDGVGRVLTILLGTGALLSVVVAWYHGERGRQSVTRVELVLITVVLAFGGVLLLRFGPGEPTFEVPQADQFMPTPWQESEAVAVLPFETRSGEDEDVYFVDGMHDEVITRLSDIEALQVVSRTSVMRYRRTTLSLPEIAREIGARYVLEGGVQRAGDQIRINAQLIDALTDAHLWAQTFDHMMTVDNMLAVQSQIARAIAEALNAELGPDDEAVLATRPTDDDDAYRLFMLASGHSARNNSMSDQLRTVELLREAVEADPSFARGWSGIAYTLSWLYWRWPGFRHVIPEARAALDRAIELAPNATQTVATEGFYAYRIELDYEAALDYFYQAYGPEGGASTHALLRRLGRWEEAVQAGVGALDRDRRRPVVAREIGLTLLHMRRYAEALEYFELAIAISGRPGGEAHLYGEIAARRDTVGLGEVAAGMDGEAQRLAAYLRGDYEAVMAMPRPSIPDAWWETFLPMPGLFLDPEIGPALSDSLRALGEDYVEVATEGAAPEDLILAAIGHMSLAYHHAIERRPGQAVAEALRSVVKMPIERDTMWGAGFRWGLVNVYLMVGDHERAADELAALLTTVPSVLSSGWVRVDPAYQVLLGWEVLKAALGSGQSVVEQGS